MFSGVSIEIAYFDMKKVTTNSEQICSESFFYVEVLMFLVYNKYILIFCEVIS